MSSENRGIKMNPHSEEDELEKKYDTYCPPPPRSIKRSGGGGSRKRLAPSNSGGRPAKRPASKPKPKKPEKSAEEPTLVIGIDFGTTNTGVAYSTGRGIKTLLRWEPETNYSQEKFPSAISYGSSIEWGKPAQGREGRLEWFKLLLADENVLPRDIQNSEQLQTVRRRLQELNKTPRTVISDFLKPVWNHALKIIKKGIGAETVNESKFHIVVTVPAIWNAAMKSSMKSAVERAGILRDREDVGNTVFEFISEPEAAAISTLADTEGRCDIKAGDSFTIVDCGGGTVDAISYLVTQKSPLIVQEAVKGEGDLAGAIFVEERVEALFAKKLREICGDAVNDVPVEQMKEIMRLYWVDAIRNEFRGETRSWEIQLPLHLILKGFKGTEGRPTFKVTSAEITEAFCPVAVKIITLLNRQIKAVEKKQGKLPKYVILVGGFGISPYLFKFISDSCYGQVEILQPEQTTGSGPWTAICHGAVRHGLVQENMGGELAVNVRSRVARASVGIVCQEVWDACKHMIEDRHFDKEQQKFMAHRQMVWLLEEGHDVMTKDLKSHPFFKLCSDSERPSVVTVTIWQTTARPLPTRMCDSITKLGEVKWKVKVNWNSLDIEHNSLGLDYRRLDYTAQLRWTGSDMQISVSHKGREVAGSSIAVEFTDDGLLY